MVCALAAETKEGEYLAMIERHKSGKLGKRGADLMGQMFGELVSAMTKSDADILGDLFQGAITYGEAGQYFSPQSIARLVAELSVDPEAKPEPGKPILVNDPACGTGRMLLEASIINPHVEVVGQDVDARCAKITAINLGLRGRYGFVICGNSLTGETQFAYRIGSFFHETPHGLRRGVIRDVPPEHTPVPVLSRRMRTQTQGLFEQEQRRETTQRDLDVSIVEVPRWLARLEPTLAALETERAVAGDSPEEAEKSEQEPDALPIQKQQRLF
jgi:hypothetical protein